MAYRILVPEQEMEPESPALEALSLNHWTAREVPFKNNVQLDYVLYSLTVFIFQVRSLVNSRLLWLIH